MNYTPTSGDTAVFTSESVTEGHPDKICDQISDAVLDAHLKASSRNPRVACETAVKGQDIFLLGEITSDAEVDYHDLVNRVLENIGYPEDSCFGPGRFNLHTYFSGQSQNIECGVDGGETLGAGDQGMMFGYACRETEPLMPLPIHLAHALTRRLSETRKSGELPWLLPDGKAQVTVEYVGGRPSRIHTVVVSAQHEKGIPRPDLEKAIREQVVDPVLQAAGVPAPGLSCLINPTGKFVIGGPEADAGLTGRKIIVDTYGGMGRHGGGAFSGKDPTKQDRSACYMARLLARCIVETGLASRCEVQLAYAIGHDKPVSLRIEDFGTGGTDFSQSQVRDRVGKHFDLSPQGIIDSLELWRPIYGPTAAYGHFGRSDLSPQLPWDDVTRDPAASFLRDLP